MHSAVLDSCMPAGLRLGPAVVWTGLHFLVIFSSQVSWCASNALRHVPHINFSPDREQNLRHCTSSQYACKGLDPLPVASAVSAVLEHALHFALATWLMNLSAPPFPPSSSPPPSLHHHISLLPCLSFMLMSFPSYAPHNLLLASPAMHVT